MDITRQGLSVEQEVVADNVECQAGAPVGGRAVGRGGGTSSSSNPCRRVTVTLFLLLGFFFLTLCDHRDEEILLSNKNARLATKLFCIYIDKIKLLHILQLSQLGITKM